MEVWLRADTGEADDHQEAVVRLPALPRPGDLIEIWDATGGIRQYSELVRCPECDSPPGRRCRVLGADPGTYHRGRVGPSGEPRWLTVKQVVLHPVYGNGDEEVIEVWVAQDGYDLSVLRGTFEAIARKDQP